MDSDPCADVQNMGGIEVKSVGEVRMSHVGYRDGRLGQNRPSLIVLRLQNL